MLFLSWTKPLCYRGNFFPSIQLFALLQDHEAMFHSFSASPSKYSSFQEKPSISRKRKVVVFKDFRHVNNLDHAVSVFNQMVQTKPIPSVVEFAKLLRVMINKKYYCGVVSFFGEMRKLGVPFDDYILTSVIDSFCLLGCTEHGFSVLGIFFKSGVQFNVVTFSTLIRGLCEQNKIKDAMWLFNKLVTEKICKIDEVMFGTVMNGLCKQGHTQTALSLLRIMEQGGPKPNTIVYSIVVDALCKDKMVGAAFNLFNEMK
ncbi:pentatricopeptide repeat-containing protein At1g62670, mitochondrial-like [Lycium barbarum]|uniref:pentatricopeptide repeat-containing protein At1g62670, mitochondrial-like n=1 Tax=Lycium barbarum TaxID=112863 RepID=UPI00293F20A4|nr:pentatricopeptide repeat-containing protein At1g62670, mitochondrial-like [Lycium barbarum]